VERKKKKEEEEEEEEGPMISFHLLSAHESGIQGGFLKLLRRRLGWAIAFFAYSVQQVSG